MKIYERERMIREESKAEGIEIGIAEEQERATQRIAEERERAIQLLTETLCEMNIPREEVVEKITSKYGISREQAENCVRQYWK